MKKTILYIFICLVFIPAVHTQVFNTPEESTASDSLIAPVMEIKPSSCEVTIDDTTKFVVREVKILNTGGSPLIIQRIQGSCGCATSTIMDNVVYPLSVGKIIFNVNLAGLSSDKAYVEYLIYTNDTRSPIGFRIHLQKQSSKTGCKDGIKSSCKKNK